MRSIGATIFTLFGMSATITLSASPQSREFTERAFAAAYNLDHSEAMAFLDKAVAADPNDPDAHRAVAVIAWLRIGFLRGSITIDDYLGSVTKPNINMLPPPAGEAQRFQRHSVRALELAEAALRARPGDIEALFRVGAQPVLAHPEDVPGPLHLLAADLGDVRLDVGALHLRVQDRPTLATRAGGHVHVDALGDVHGGGGGALARLVVGMGVHVHEPEAGPGASGGVGRHGRHRRAAQWVR